MDKKLFKVTINIPEIVVYAENAVYAREIAIDMFSEHIETIDVSEQNIWTAGISSKEEIPLHWNENCLPFVDVNSEEEEMTIGKILSSNKSLPK